MIISFELLRTLFFFFSWLRSGYFPTVSRSTTAGQLLSAPDMSWQVSGVDLNHRDRFKRPGRRDGPTRRSLVGSDFGYSPSSTAGARLSRLSLRSSPGSLPGCPGTSACCDWLVRFGRSGGIWLGERTDSASEKHAGSSSLRKLVGGPWK